MLTDIPEYARHIPDLIRALYQRFQAEDKPVFDSILQLYQGRFWSAEGPLAVPGIFAESEMVKSSVNLVFSVAETSKSVLVPPNPQVTLRDEANELSLPAKATERGVNKALREANLVQELAMYVDDIVLFGRGVLKTGWDTTENLPWVRLVDINALQFDHEAKRVQDIRYWVECVALSERALNDRIESGLYPKEVKDYLRKSRYPDWLRRLDDDPNLYLQQTETWYVVYEYYDAENKRTYHWSLDTDCILLETDLLRVPYHMGFFNHNKKDCGGLSEILLVASNQAELNILMSMLLEVVRKSIPGVAFDTRKVTSDDVEKMSEAPVGAFVGVKLEGDNATLDNTFRDLPQPQAPNMLVPLIDMMWRNITFVSALADAQRGAVSGAKTATELAFIDAQLKNRLSSRQRVVDAAVVSIAHNFLYLMAQYSDDEKALTIKMGDEVVQVTRDLLNSAPVKFDMVPYSATPTNREVIRERFLAQIYPAMKGDPAFDQMKLAMYFLEVAGLPSDLLAPPAPVQPPGPPPGTPPAVPPGLPPELAQGLPPAPQAPLQAVAEPTSQMGAPMIPQG